MTADTSTRQAPPGGSGDVDALLACFFDLSADVLAVASPDGDVERVNPAWSNVLGFADEDVLGRPWLDVVHPDDRALAEESLASLAADGAVVSFDTRCLTASGTVRWMAWTCRTIRTSSVVLISGRHVTAQQRRERIDRARALAAIAINNSSAWSDAVSDVLAVLRAELGWADRHREPLATDLAPGGAARVVEPLTDDETALFDDVSRDLSDFAGRLAGSSLRRGLMDLDLVGTDVRALRDAVTGLPNELLMTDRLEMALNTAWRAGSTVAVLAVGFNGFTSVSLDQALDRDVDAEIAREVAARLQACGAAWGSVGRLSDNTYVLVAAAGIDALRARRLAADICAAFEAPLVCAGGATVGVSVGVSMYPSDAEDNLNLLRCAEAALQSSRARASGWSCYEPAMLFEGVAAT